MFSLAAAGGFAFLGPMTRMARLLGPTLAILGALAVLLPVQAATVGDTYAQVVAEKGEPAGKVEAGDVTILRYPDCTIKLKDQVVISVKAARAATSAAPAAQAPSPVPKTPQERIAALRLEERRAVHRVVEIVNQPLEQYPITRDMTVGQWGDIWFHPGAETPDFDNVDVTKFEDDKNYVGKPFEYATSNMNHGIAFRLSDMGFNSKTKMFYTDRTIPKKRLTFEEMQEINRLYRIIGRCNSELQSLGVNPVIEIE